MSGPGSLPARGTERADSDVGKDASLPSKVEAVRDRTLISEHVRTAEEGEVRKRRAKMFPLSSGRTPESPDGDAKARIVDAVGLTLSGGGVRSASFNLGLLQALVEKGLIRWVDYLSTVSGGGFIGTYWSTLLAHDNTKKLDKNFAIVPKRGGGQPEPVEKFIRGGSYLKEGSLMADRFLIGFLLNGIVWISLLVVLTSGLAWLWRCLDSPALIVSLRNKFPTIGAYYLDWSRPFVPALGFFLLWLTMWLLTYALCYTPQFDFPSEISKSKSGKWLYSRIAALFRVPAGWLGSVTAGGQSKQTKWQKARDSVAPQREEGLWLKPRSWFFWLFLFSLVIGLASLLATDDIPLTGLPGISDEQARSPRNRMHGATIVGILLISFVLLNFLPYLNPVRIFRSEVRPPGKFEKSLLKWAGGALLVMVPVSMVFAFSRENISGYATNRTADFVAADISNSFAFLSALESAKANRSLPGDGTATTSDDVGRLIYDELAKRLLTEKFPFGTEGRYAHGCLSLSDSQLVGKTLPEALSERARDPRWSDLKVLIGSATEPGNPPPMIESFDQLLTLGKLARERMSTKGGAKSQREYRVCYFAMQLTNCYVAAILNQVVPTASQPVQYARDALAGPALTGREPYGPQATDKRKAFIARIKELRGAREFEDDLWPKTVLEAGPLSSDDRKSLSRLILEAIFPDYIEERNKANLPLTWEYDQRTRLVWLGCSLLCFGVFGVLVNMNATSLHGYFRKKIHDAYVVQESAGQQLRSLDTVSKGGPYHFLCATLNFFDTWPWKATEYSSAYTFVFSRLFCGAQPLEPTQKERDRGDGCTGYIDTEQFCGGVMDTATAAALSGAAFSPAVIRNSLLFFMSMFLNLRLGQWLPNPRRYDPTQTPLVARLSKELKMDDGQAGLWTRMRLTWPATWLVALHYCRAKGIASSYMDVQRALRVLGRSDRRVTIFGVLTDVFMALLGLKQPRDWLNCFVTDGGHNDNLGVSPVIFRRCRLIIISDATQDTDSTFVDFIKAYRRYRTRGEGMPWWRLESWKDLARKVPLKLRALRPQRRSERTDVLKSRKSRTSLLDRLSKSRLRLIRMEEPAISDRHFILSRLDYSKAEGNEFYKEAIVVYLKSTMTGDEPADLKQYQIENPHFPNDPTTDQFFTENQVESYRQLGHHIGLDLCDTILDGVCRNRENRARCEGEIAYSDFWEPERSADGSAPEAPDLSNLSVEDIVDGLIAGYARQAGCTTTGRRVTTAAPSGLGSAVPPARGGGPEISSDSGWRADLESAAAGTLASERIEPLIVALDEVLSRGGDRAEEIMVALRESVQNPPPRWSDLRSGLNKIGEKMCRRLCSDESSADTRRIAYAYLKLGMSMTEEQRAILQSFASNPIKDKKLKDQVGNLLRKAAAT